MFVSDHIEVEFCVQEEETDGASPPVSLGWLGWSYHDTYDEAVATMNAMRPKEGRLRVAKVTTEELLVREDTLCPEAP